MEVSEGAANGGAWRHSVDDRHRAPDHDRRGDAGRRALVSDGTDLPGGDTASFLAVPSIGGVLGVAALRHLGYPPGVALVAGLFRLLDALGRLWPNEG